MFTFDRSDRLDASMRRWRLYIITGVIWALWGLMVSAWRPSSVASVALLIGITFIFGGVGQLLLAQRVHEWKWLFYVSGVLAIIAGIMAFVWLGKTLLVVALFVVVP